MSLTPRLLLSSALGLLCLGLPGLTLIHGQEQKQAPPARLDAAGDPLLVGAIARLGSVRLTHPGMEFLHAAVSPDGKTIATCRRRQPRGAQQPAITPSVYDIRLWDRATGKMVREIDFGKGGRVHRITFSPDGKYLAVQSGQLIRMLPMTPGDFENINLWGLFAEWTSFTFSADGKQAYAADQRGKIHVWSLHPVTKLIHEWTPPAALKSRSIRTAAIAANGKVAAYAHSATPTDRNSTVIEITDLATGKILQHLDGDNLPTEHLTLSADGSLLATLNYAGAEVVVIDTATGKVRHRLASPAAFGTRFSLDGKTLATSGLVAVWDVASGKRRANIPGHDAFSVDISADGKTLVTATDGAVRVWDLATGKETPAFPGHRDSVRELAFLGPATLVSTCKQQTIYWNAKTWSQKSAHPLASDVLGKAYFVNSRGSFELMVTREAEGQYAVRERLSGKLRKMLPPTKEEWRDAVFSPDGKTLALFDRVQVRAMHFFDVASAKPLHVLSLKEQSLVAMSFSADGTTVAIDQGPRGLLLHDARTGKLKRALGGPSGPNPSQWSEGALTFSGDGQYVSDLWAFSNGNLPRQLHIWQTETGQHLGVELVSHHPALSAVKMAAAFSPDSRLLAYAPFNAEEIYLLESATGLRRGVLRGTPGVSALAFSSDGKLLATGQVDGTIMIWDMAKGLGARPAPAKPVGAADLAAQWQSLGDMEDGDRVEQAVRALASAGKIAVGFLKQKLTAVPAPPAAKVKAWVADLNNSKFPVRQKAQHELAKLKDLAIPYLKAALQSPGISLEAHLRLEQALERALEHRLITPEVVLQMRAVEVLERIGDQGARQLLQELADGAPGARLTQEASSALKRLGKG